MRSTVTNTNRKYIDYRPKLEYEYKKRITKLPPETDGGYIFIHNGALACDVEKEIQDIKQRLDETIELAKKYAGPLYDEYKAALDLPHCHDKYQKIEDIEKKMADIEGNVAVEALPLLEDMRRDWDRIEDVFNNTVVSHINEEFEDGTLKDKELKLDKLMRQLMEEKNAANRQYADAMCMDPDSIKTEELRIQYRITADTLEDAENLANGRTDVCSIIDNRYCETLELVEDMKDLVPKTPQDILDKELLDVLQYILENINKFGISVKEAVKNIQSLLRLTIDEKISHQFASRDKMRIATQEHFKKFLSDNFKDTYNYRQKISTKTLHIFEDITIETSRAFNNTMDVIINGAMHAENNYVDQMVGYDKVTAADVNYKTIEWDKIRNKELSRVLYKALESLGSYLESGTPPDKDNLRPWLATFCQSTGLNTSYDSEQSQEIQLF